ncbi:hypothetical protein IMCC20628_03587 [Hoeflea sp. IMCC20628]|nr:hypothetical protein IMCC20628_03587 [Hoeflea sp. IMCC20628]
MEERKSRRNCYDAFRNRVMLARRRRQVDPAFSAAHQLLAIFGLITLSIPMPTNSSRSSSPFQRSSDERKQFSVALGIAPRYVDIFLKSGTVPYSLLLDHLRGAATRKDALVELRNRMPAVCLDWLTDIERDEDWARLSLCRGLDGDEQTELKMLRAAARWEEERAFVLNDPALVANGGDGGAPPPVARPNPDPDRLRL